MSEQTEAPGSFCIAQSVISLVSGKWRVQIIARLGEHRQRFGHLLRIMPGLRQKVLTQELRTLEAQGVVSRMVVTAFPVPHVEYELTALGMEAQTLLWMIDRWGREHLAANRGASNQAP